MALLVSYVPFWPAKTMKNLKFLRCSHVFELVLKCCSHLNKGRWLKISFYPILLVNESALFIEVVFFNFVSHYKFSFNRFSVLRKRFQMESKNDLITYGMILHLFGRYLLPFVTFITAWTEICRNCSSAIVFWQYRFFAIVCLRGIQFGSLKFINFSAKNFSNID